MVPVPLVLRWLVLPLAGVAALGVALVEYQTLRSLQWERPAETLSELVVRQPWGGLSGQALASTLDDTLGLEPDAAESVLAWQLQRYPLAPSRWFSRALNAHYAGACPTRVLEHLQAALAVQPAQPAVKWEAVSLSVDLGRYDLAERYLRDWLEGQPAHRTGEALAAAYFWIPDAAELIERILPAEEEYLLAALDFARRVVWLDLAEQAWRRLPHPRPPDDPALFDFVDVALDEGELDRAMAAWQASLPDDRPGAVPNADFQRELGPGRGFTWRTRLPAGARVSRDEAEFVTAPASLRLDFDGRENLRVSGLGLRIPTPPGANRWILTGQWRAEGLTTASLPYLLLSGEDGRDRLDVPATSFDWTPFALDVETSGDGVLLQLQIGRDPTRHDFDRFLSGQLWLDALRLEPVTAPATD